MSERRASNPEPAAISRRRFIGLTLLGSLVATIAGVLTPIIAYLWPPPQTGTAGSLRVRVGSVDEFPVNSGKVVSVNNEAVIVVHSEQGGLGAFSAVCTHLGCIVYWHEERKVIQCPCHDGRFNPLSGQVILGPPPAPLAGYRLEVEGDAVYVESGNAI